MSLYTNYHEYVSQRERESESWVMSVPSPSKSDWPRSRGREMGVVFHQSEWETARSTLWAPLGSLSFHHTRDHLNHHFPCLWLISRDEPIHTEIHHPWVRVCMIVRVVQASWILMVGIMIMRFSTSFHPLQLCVWLHWAREYGSGSLLTFSWGPRCLLGEMTRSFFKKRSFGALPFTRVLGLKRERARVARLLPDKAHHKFLGRVHVSWNFYGAS